MLLWISFLLSSWPSLHQCMDAPSERLPIVDSVLRDEIAWKSITIKIYEPLNFLDLLILNSNLGFLLSPQSINIPSAPRGPRAQFYKKRQVLQMS